MFCAIRRRGTSPSRHTPRDVWIGSNCGLFRCLWRFAERIKGTVSHATPCVSIPSKQLRARIGLSTTRKTLSS